MTRIIVELDEGDAVAIGQTLRSLAHTRLADSSAAERLERVGDAMVAASAGRPLGLPALIPATERSAILSMLGELVADDPGYWQDDSAVVSVCRMSGIAIDEVLAFAIALNAHVPCPHVPSAPVTASVQTRVAELEATLAALAKAATSGAESIPLLSAVAEWSLADRALDEAAKTLRECADECVRVERAGEAERVATALRRRDNAAFWRGTCQQKREVATEALFAAVRKFAPPPKAAESILRIVLGDACVVAEAIQALDAHGVGGWAFACQCCDLKWSQPDRGDATALEHMRVAHPVTSGQLCITNPLSSATCSRGTRCCDVQHAEAARAR